MTPLTKYFVNGSVAHPTHPKHPLTNPENVKGWSFAILRFSDDKNKSTYPLTKPLTVKGGYIIYCMKNLYLTTAVVGGFSTPKAPSSLLLLMDSFKGVLA